MYFLTASSINGGIVGSRLLLSVFGGSIKSFRSKRWYVLLILIVCFSKSKSSKVSARSSPERRPTQNSSKKIGYSGYCPSYRLEKGAEAAGLPQIRVHDLRHSHASLLIPLGFSPLVIQERLGHENVETTLNTYSHLYPSQQGELVMKLQEGFNR